jgi:nucleotide-binding universal stress UspA family protein
MFQIIVPTDFSPLSLVAADYAINISKQMTGANITFLHCIETMDVTKGIVHKVEDILIKEAEVGLKELAEKYLPGLPAGIHLEYSVVFGNIPKRINQYAKEHDIDLIVSGTHGAGGFKKVFGTNSAGIAENAPCPVLVVPKNTHLKEIKTIVYASDLHDVRNEIEPIIAFAKLFSAHINILHVYESEPDTHHLDITKTTYDLVKQHNYANLSFHPETETDITDGIEKHLEKNKVAIIAMYRRHKTFFEKIFNKSITREMAFYTHIPLLVIPYDITL